MGTKIKLLDWLKMSRRQWVSGEQISNRLGISRTAIWKQINQLKADGHEIESAPKKGYRLVKTADLLEAEQLQAHLKTQTMGRPAIYLHPKTDSTNLQAKILAGQGAAEGTVVAAETQTHGRGRRGRTWFSPAHRNIYASIILRPSMAPSQAPQITLMTAVAVANTLNRLTGLQARIKWPNDILIDGKKVAGILNEISTEMDMVDYVVVGLGINVNIRKKQMPQQIREIATSIRIETGSDISRTDLLCDLLAEFEICYEQLKAEGFTPIMDQWRGLTDIIGQQVNVDLFSTRCTGTVEAVDDDGVLIVRDGRGEIHRIFSGDVTQVRPKG
ncbi:MAG: biotin--[acetyl-CoA-carboxylase] ligase [Desulfobacteraceae bacterium]|jgi:BirA family biotin operon repressor/biotin-[acetyl-CoA-carboxylase] ligase